MTDTDIVNGTSIDLTIDEPDIVKCSTVKRQRMSSTPIAIVIKNVINEGTYGATIYLNQTGNLNPEMEWIILHMRMGIDRFSKEMVEIFHAVVSDVAPTKKELNNHAQSISKQYASVDEAFLLRARADNKWWKAVDGKQINTETGALTTPMRIIIADAGEY
jgi:hypothetical protein